MKNKKMLSFLLASTMMLSLTACGSNESSSDGNSSSNPAPTQSAEENKVDDSESTKVLVREIPAGAITFEDSKYDFAVVNEGDKTVDTEYTLGITQVNSQNVLNVTRPNNKDIMLGVDISSMLGDKLADCASFSVDLGIIRDGAFAAASGDIITYTGEDNAVSKTAWTIYKENETAKTFTVDLGDARFAEGATNIFVVSITSDSDAANPCSVYIDNIIAYDASGSVIPLDAAATMNAPAGFGEIDWSNMVKAPTDEESLGLNGMSGSGWWPVSNLTGTVYEDYATEVKIDPAKIVPGSVITIYYVESQDMKDGGWQRPFLWLALQDSLEEGAIWASVRCYVAEAEDDTGKIDDPTNYVNQTHTICQFTYEQIDEAVHNFLFDSSIAGSDYSKDLTDEQREDYYANWPNYLIMFGIGDMGSEYQVVDTTIGTAAK